MKVGFAVILALVVVGVCMLLVDVVPPRAMTQTRMRVTERRIRAYVAEHKRLPTKLAELPRLGCNYDERTLDGWGRELIYAFQPDGSVVLSSFGKSGKTDDKEAVVVRFAVELSLQASLRSSASSAVNRMSTTRTAPGF